MYKQNAAHLYKGRWSTRDSLEVSRKTTAGSYYTSYEHTRQDGVELNTFYDKDALRFNLEHTIGGVTAKTTYMLKRIKQQSFNYGIGGSSTYNQAFWLNHPSPWVS